MKFRKLIKHLRSHGCSFKEGAKHTRVYHPGARRWSAVPRHPEVDGMLVREICKQLGIPAPVEK